MNVYFSHTGINNYLPETVAVADNLIALIDELNQRDEYMGIKNVITSKGKLDSSVRIFANVDVTSEKKGTMNVFRYYEREKTVEISSLNYDLNNCENILINIFDPSILLELLDKGLSNYEDTFDYIDGNGQKKNKKYKPITDKIDFDVDVKIEEILGFRFGECTLGELKINRGENAKIEYAPSGFNKEKSKLLPADMVSAISELWEIEEGEGRLRLFQEDALFFIMSQLMDIDKGRRKQLLLSMPTGGGKTEAFMIPILSNIYQKKSKENLTGIKSIIIYPTNALANDQALRFVEIIYKINKKLSDEGVPSSKHLSIGILSGDTPNKSKDLTKESLIRICPKCGKSNFEEVNGELVCQTELPNGKACNTSLSFCRLTKEDIINDPPDILITNPDEINFALHSPKYLPIFKSKIESIVFDEVHIYQGVFGCHISHLLRRLEECIGEKPLYIGMSATIGNAVELAALLFDESTENIEYIRNENNKYLNDVVIKKRVHALITPYLKNVVKTKSGLEKSKYVRTMSVAGSIGLFIGHLISDSHFRKSIIFTNYRSEADDLAGYLKERERLDVKEYFDSIIESIEKGEALSQEDIEICLFLNKWFNVINSRLKYVNNKVEIGWNRGGLEKEERIRSIHKFSRNALMSDKDDDSAYPIDVMVATKSLEVGIDIGDVTTVINSSAPFTVNEYVQRVGRGGRKKDSLAITVINPESAIDAHLKNDFEDYIYPSKDSFEDAPIIVNNAVIIERHVKARIIDYLVSEFIVQTNGRDILMTVNDIINGVKITDCHGNVVKIGPDCTDMDVVKYSDALYFNIFESNCCGVGQEIERFLDFLNRESEILGTSKCELSIQTVKSYIKEVVNTINIHTQPKGQGKWSLDSNITGFRAVMPELMPALRGSGAVVGLYIGDKENAVDIVSRQTAFNSMPISSDEAIASTKSGISTFKIEDDKGESDGDAETEIKRQLYTNQHMANFFVKKFEDFPYDPNDVMVLMTQFKAMVPNKLRVSYFPSRFYCENCKHGLTPGDYVERDDGVYCKKCGKRAQQLHKIYICEKDDCGALYDPMIPKMCINKDCRSTKKAYGIYKQNNRYSKEMLDCFKFRLTKDLEWVCKSCGTRINFLSWQRLFQGNTPSMNTKIQELISSKEDQTIIGMCRQSLFYPETMNYDYKINNGREPYKCKEGKEHKKRKSVGVPRVKTIAYNYVGVKRLNDKVITLCPNICSKEVNVDFTEGFVIQLAKDYMRRFSSGTGESETFTLKTEKIVNHGYWANFYNSHLAWVKLSERINEFIESGKGTCDGNCLSCVKLEKLDLGKMMRPELGLEDYNFDSVNGVPKKPDHRGKFCKIAMDNECMKQQCVCTDGETCEHFNQNAFLRYLIVHTIKHGVIWALPKYAGVSASEIKGEIYPNDDGEKTDFVLIDNNEGGSGAIHLIQKHWNKIWNFAEEIIKLTAENKANIILPHTCFRYNSDLCPFITGEFFDFLKNDLEG